MGELANSKEEFGIRLASGVFLRFDDLRVSVYRYPPFTKKTFQAVVPEVLELLSRLQSAFPNPLPESSFSPFQTIVQSLINGAIVERVPMHTLDWAGRYGRQLTAFHGIGLDAEVAQKRLQSSIVTIIGLGGAGSSVLQGIAAVGIGKIRLIDADQVEVSNLGRQTIYTFADVGKPKVECAASWIDRFNPDIEVVISQSSVDEPIRDGHPLYQFIHDSSLVINCADSPNIGVTTLRLLAATLPNSIPMLVGGGYFIQHGFCGPTIRTKLDPCPLCMSDHSDFVTEGGKRGGTLAPIAISVGQIAVLEAVRLLTNDAESILRGKRWVCDFSVLSSKLVPLVKNPECACNRL